MKRLLYITLLFTSSLYAQHSPTDTLLNRTVVVEQEYSPLIEDATKINVLPGVEAPSVVNRPVEYAIELFPATTFPVEPMNSYTASEQQSPAKRGYLRAGAGNFGNLDLYGNYHLRPSQQSALNIQASIGGHNGELDIPLLTDAQWKSRFYRTHAGAEYTHAFNKVNLQAAGHFDVSNFNLLYDGHQRFTSGDVQVGIHSNQSSQKLQYSLHTALLLYQRAHDWEAQKETILRTHAQLYLPLADNTSRAGIAMQLNNNFVQERNYSTIDLNPYYRKQADKWQLQLGAIIALATEYGEELYLSPDVRFDYQTSKNSTLYLQATGGRRLNDFRRLEALHPYIRINMPYESGFEQLNASVGFKIGSDAGSYLHLFGGYQMLSNELLAAMPKPNEDSYINYFEIATPTFLQTDVNNLYAGAQLAYHHKQLFGIEASLMYQSWEEKSSLATYDHLLPQLTAHVALQFTPLHQLQCQAGYRHISYSNEGSASMPDNYGNLYLKANYTLFNGIGIYLQASNLLGNDNQCFVGYPSEKANFLGGVTFQF